MRKIVMSAAMVAIFGAAVSAKDIRKVSVSTEPPMHCANCEKKIKNFFRFEKGIKRIDTSVPEQRVTITYDADKTSEVKIIDAFSKIDYKVEKREETAEEQSPE